jgi:mRNA-degrading endonuclease RelE of RelBE toxin-antitoxin system
LQRNLAFPLNKIYSLEIEEMAEKFLKRLSKQESELILKKLHSIRNNPHRFVKKLSGNKLWRLRVKDYRAIIDIIITKRKIIVLRIGMRKNIY